MVDNTVQMTCERAGAVLAHCAGGFLDTVAFAALGERDYLDIKIVQTLKWPMVSLLLEDVRHVTVDKGPDIASSLVDEITLTPLLRTATTWPSEADGLVTRFDGLPDLYWLRLVGPTMITAVGAIMTVSTSPDFSTLA
ncbi:hypothetical protein [Nonomuraea sp. NPDC049625]|uniref:hypothetical protein n=1 Tax=Nonomuraea sp. NPDC049625 TaxID=3155775 RepID=UPI003439E438